MNINDLAETAKVDGRNKKVVRPIPLAKRMDRPPQMLYTYIRQGHIHATRTDTGRIVIPFGEAKKWVDTFSDRTHARAERLAEFDRAAG